MHVYIPFALLSGIIIMAYAGEAASHLGGSPESHTRAGPGVGWGCY